MSQKIKLTENQMSLINSSYSLFQNIKKNNDSKFAQRASMICLQIQDLVDSIMVEDIQDREIDEDDKDFRYI